MSLLFLKTEKHKLNTTTATGIKQALLFLKLPQMKVLDRQPFLLAVLAVLFILFSLVVKPAAALINPELAFLGLFFAILYWVWGINKVKTGNLKNNNRLYWLIITVILPFVGVLLYQFIVQRKVF